MVHAAVPGSNVGGYFSSVIITWHKVYHMIFTKCNTFVRLPYITVPSVYVDNMRKCGEGGGGGGRGKGGGTGSAVPPI